jgi:GNAT superfamily N-acetyltransferase
VIGELGIKLQLASGERYLWDFVTLPDFRGQGIYAGMLQAILATEADAQRFWIGHDFGNVASARGILKAGFQPVNALYREADGRFVLYAYPEVEGRPTVLERAAAGAVVLGLSLAGQLTTSPS